LTRCGIGCLILSIVALSSLLVAQTPTDLQVQLRSSTGSNRFQIGEVIPLEVVLSGSTPNRYLEPCVLFRESNFGFPQCRFFTRWSFTITPDGGWVDLTKEFPSGPALGGGPTVEVPDRDLTSQPETFSYVLTHRYRFDKPGEYRVHLSIDVGLDDETTKRTMAPDSAVKPHSVTATPEIVLQIVPASAEWQKQLIQDGYEAYSGPVPGSTNPPSQEMLRYQQATEALCNLGTPEAARVLAKLLSPQHQDIQRCLDHTPSPDAAIQEMRRLLVDPDVPVNSLLFSELVGLVGRAEFKTEGTYMITQPAVQQEREVLLSALPRKHGEAHVTSLLTLLYYPPRAKGSGPMDSGYDLPFDRPVIEDVVAHFDDFPWESRQWLLKDAWPRIRSPLMLPLLRRFAENGHGQSLLRWTELDPATANEFMRKEIVRPVPRFSSSYLRLPESSLHGQEAQLAANFVELTKNEDLLRSASLLHRYATRAVLPLVLPFIEAKSADWPCQVQYPVLAYLLKVSPSDALPRVEQAAEKAKQDDCDARRLFTGIGYLEPGPVLEKLAMTQIETATPLARDAADYLRLHGSAAAKLFVWKQLIRWHEQAETSGAEKRARAGTFSAGDDLQNTLVRVLTEAYERAQGWVLSPEEFNSMEALLGKQVTAQLSCQFSCGTTLGIGPGPGNFYIYGGANPAWTRNEIEYLNPTERLRYSINQYSCPDMQALKQKILQFPAGSSFGFAYEFSGADRNELTEISDFLWTHGYKMKTPQNWNFLRPLPESELLILPVSSETLDVTGTAEIKRTWGPVQAGVRADLTVDRLNYPIGEDVVLHIAVENVSGTQPVYGEPFRPRPAFSGYRSSTVKVVVQDEDGPLTARLASSSAEAFGGPSVCPPPYPLGTPIQVEQSLRQLGLLPSKTGTYKITVTWSPYTSDILSCDAVPRSDPRAPPEKPFISVPSNAIFLQISGGPSPFEAEYTEWKKHFSLTDTSFGEKTALLDKATHLEWLRLNLTAGLSYEQVTAQLATEGQFAGWRMATVEELQLFFAHFTGSPTGHSTDPMIERKLQRLLGGPLNEVSNPAIGWYRRDSTGFVGDPAGPDNNMIHYHAGYMTEESGGFNIDPESGGSFAPGVASLGWGSFLVRHESGN
jgi:hypothetical protein